MSNFHQSKQTTPKKKEQTPSQTKIKNIATVLCALTVMFLCILLVPNQSVNAYYTIDINPSFCLQVDENDVVIDIEFINDDAEQLKDRINCIGLPIEEAIEMIITVASDAGYIADEQYILIGKFSENDEEDLTDLQAQLEEDFGDMAHLLVVNGTLDDKQTADELNVSAGLLKLSELAGKTEISEEEKVEDIVGIPHVDPNVSGEVLDHSIHLNWTKESANDLSGYKIVTSASNPNPSYPDDGYIKYITDASVTSVTHYMKAMAI